MPNTLDLNRRRIKLGELQSLLQQLEEESASLRGSIQTRNRLETERVKRLKYIYDEFVKQTLDLL